MVALLLVVPCAAVGLPRSALSWGCVWEVPSGSALLLDPFREVAGSSEVGVVPADVLVDDSIAMQVLNVDVRGSCFLYRPQAPALSGPAKDFDGVSNSQHGAPGALVSVPARTKDGGERV